MVRLVTSVAWAILVPAVAVALQTRHGPEEHDGNARDSSSAIASVPDDDLRPSHADPPNHMYGDRIGLNPALSIPQAEPGQLVPVPWIPGGGAGTHDHSLKHKPVLTTLNETNLFLSSGPMPLSYIEWDFGYAMGRDEEMARFTSAESLARPERLMGDIEGIWRTLIDLGHLSESERKLAEHKLASYVPDDGNIRRHKHLMTLHVTGCVVSTLVLCPVGVYYLSSILLLIHSEWGS